mmetsp:Transcript_22484/g.57810  ORF Transcript_22484/g.57810 Transcript_22484/m.57810 type:complete len:316 (-) Transcript_22484:1029-1976(-)
MVAKSDCSSGAQSTSQHDAENSRHRAATLLGRDGRDGRPPNCRRIASRRRALGPTLSPSSLRSSSVRSCRSGSRTSSAARVGKRSPSALACRNLARPSALESGGGSACAITGVRGDAPKKVGTAASAPATPVGCAACRRIGPSCFSRSAAQASAARGALGSASVELVPGLDLVPSSVPPVDTASAWPLLVADARARLVPGRGRRAPPESLARVRVAEAAARSSSAEKSQPCAPSAPAIGLVAAAAAASAAGAGSSSRLRVLRWADGRAIGWLPARGWRPKDSARTRRVTTGTGAASGSGPAPSWAARDEPTAAPG